MKKRTEHDDTLQRIRTARALATRRTGYRSPRGTTAFSSNQIQSLLKLTSEPKACPRPDRVFSLRLPRKFSIIENPEESLHHVFLVANQIENTELKTLHLDHSDVTKHDLSAEILLGIAASDIKKTALFRNRKVGIQGTYPASLRKKRLIQAMGVVKKLEIHSEIVSPVEGKVEIFDFKGTKDEFISLGSLDRKNLCSQKFVDHINKCLSHNDRKLTSDSIQSLLDFVGEIIGNCEDHSGEPHWYVCAYLDDTHTAESEDDLHFCEIVIYNFGKSIADTFNELPKSSYAYSLVAPYMISHSKNRFFRQKWNKDDLLTLASLQSHISSKHQGQDSDRGQGTIDFIKFFQEVAEECAPEHCSHTKMALVSGRTHILFDDKYRLRRDHNGRELIAFNAENDLHKPPDKDNVKHMEDYHFPGTLIGIRFPIGSEQTVSNED